jgi:hypothetical protein
MRSGDELLLTWAVTDGGRICQRLDIARQIAGVKVGSEPSEVPPTPTLTTYGLTVIETVDLLDVVVGDGYVGPAWDELQRRLVVRAFSDLERAIRSGAIYQRCARARVRIPRRPELQRYPYPDDIAAEVVGLLGSVSDPDPARGAMGPRQRDELGGLLRRLLPARCR